jgi:hypothetical protein
MPSYRTHEARVIVQEDENHDGVYIVDVADYEDAGLYDTHGVRFPNRADADAFANHVALLLRIPRGDL